MVVSIWIKLAAWLFYLLSLAALIYYIVLIARKTTLHEQFHYIRFNTAVATLGALTSIFSTEFKHPKEACRILACFIHYFYLALGAWFIMEAHALYAAVLYGVIGGRERCYLLIGWGEAFLPRLATLP
ncbi:GPR133 [Cordylochernes scorpioides]|nr:GPR133 [Cordylochernes scorpioides]